ncbi:MAG TPA: UDP-N-acetylmuramoyl-tripeptide--D-alanyl-D-alanine ligase [Caulobacteraceae bacterium]
MPRALWTSKEIVAATGGRLAGDAFSAHGVSIDSRTLRPGDLFVALAGERDGHGFLDQAFAAGAAGALTSRPAGGACVVVDDTLEALRRLGEAARRRAPRALRGAVTGSVGKTSVTQAVLAGLRRGGAAHGSVQSYNNHFGVPLTLARMPQETLRAVFEIGMNHAGEIAPLAAMVKPRAVAVTSVGAVHVENFADGEAGVARAKSEIFAGMESGGVAVLDADSPWFELLGCEARRRGAILRTFGVDAVADARLESFTAAPIGALLKAKVDGEVVEFPLHHAAIHWGAMSLCVLLMLQALEIDLADGVAALTDFQPLEGRGAERQIEIAGGAFTVVDESYNANPISMRAALRTLGARTAEGRKLVVLTDMLELGEDREVAHAALAGPIEDAGVDLVFCAGPLMKRLWEALSPTRRGGYASCAADLSPQLVRTVEPGDLVMVKGSKGSKAWAVMAAVASLDAARRGGD